MKRILNMKNKLLFFGILFLLSLNCVSQETKQYFTFYSNGYLEFFDDHVHVNKAYQAILLFPSFAYQKEINRFLYQIDFMPFLFDTRDHIEIENPYMDGLKQSLFECSLGVILKYRFLIKGHYNLSICIENRAFFSRNSYDFFSDIFYDYSYNNYGISSSLGFEMELPINDKFAITGMPMYRLNEFYLQQSINKNPAIPLNKQSISNFRDSFNPLKYTFKLGVKIKI